MRFPQSSHCERRTVDALEIDSRLAAQGAIQLLLIFNFPYELLSLCSHNVHEERNDKWLFGDWQLEMHLTDQHAIK